VRNETNAQVMEYLSKMGERGHKTLIILGKMQDYITAVNSKIGQELMSELITEHERLLIKVASLEATDEDKAYYKAVSRLLGVWATKIATYENKLKEVLKEKGKKKND
jgi:hypothetical protein